MQRRRRLIWIVVCAVGVAAAGIFLLYRDDMQAIEAQIAAGSEIADTAAGPVEYASWGSGPPAMIVHGAGGGYDQGRLLAEAFAGDGFRWIAPSRFGYLRTPLPGDASTGAQAAAFAALLDTLGIDRAAVVAVSGGGPPALKFAELYPERTAALVLISSAPYTPFTDSGQDLPVPAWVYQLLFRSDFPYWAMQALARPSLAMLYDATPARRAALSPEDGALLDALIDGFQPVSGRIDGLANEGAAIDPAARYALEAISVPTLVVHARDDGINPFAIGVNAAWRIPDAELMALDTGGHLSLGHHAEIRDRVRAFLREHSGE